MPLSEDMRFLDCDFQLPFHAAHLLIYFQKNQKFYQMQIKHQEKVIFIIVSQ